MRSFLIILLLSWFSSNSYTAQAQNFKKALKHIEKGKYEKALDLTSKSPRKATVNPGANYVLSILYLTESFPGYHQDSAWNNILIAEKLLADTDEKTLKRLSRTGIDEMAIVNQKLVVDTAVFLTTLEINTIAGYNRFIDRHPSSSQIPEAILRRDALAWEDAKREDTYPAYLNFLQTYPNSRQAKEAQELYEVLLYEVKTDDNNLTSYIQFLKDFPDTPFRKEAENSIFNLGVSGTYTSGYIWFIKNYPESELVGKAVNFLYHLFKEENDPVGFYNHYTLHPCDSLLQVIQLEYVPLLPVYDEGLFGYYDTQWNVVMDHAFTEIDKDHLCGNVTTDYFPVAKGTEKMILSKTGSVIYQGDYSNVDDLGYGFLKITKNGSASLWHKAGHKILDFGFQDIKVLNNRLLKFLKDGKWGIKSFTGIEMLKNSYDDIYSMNGFVLIKKDGKIAVTHPDQIILAMDEKMPELEFYLDMVEAIDDTHLLGFLGNNETLIGPGQEVLIPLGEQKIYRLNQGWIVNIQDSFRAYTASATLVFDTLFAQALYNDRWLALKNKDKWVFFGDDRTFAEGFVYDSVRLISPNFAYLSTNGKSGIYFNDKGMMEISPAARLSIIRPSSWSVTEKPTEYLLVSDRNRRWVYDVSGSLILEGVYNQVAALGNEYLLIETGGRRGLADNKGNILIKPAFEAIGNYNQGYVSLLRSRKFGIFNHQKKIQIMPQYDAMLRPFNDSLLLACVNDNWGLIDASNRRVLDFNYKEIHPWNQDRVLVRTHDDMFNIIDLRSRLPVYGGIERYQLIRDDSEEKIAVVLRRSQHGVISNRRGEVISPGFTDIINLGTQENPVYLAQRTIREAEFIVAVYYGADGSILKRLAMTEDEFDRIYCD
jgi:hypothetical protein